MAGAAPDAISYVGPKREGLRIGSINIYSLGKKLNVVADMINYYKFDILMINETKFKPGDEPDVKIPGYRHERHDRPTYSKTGSGGLLVYIHNTMDIINPGDQVQNTVNNSTTDNTKYYQYLTIQLNDPLPIHLVSFYKSPDFEDNKFCSFLENFLSKPELENCPFMFLGDLNMNDRGPLTDPLPKLKSDKSLNQFISHDTYLQFTTGDIKKTSALHDLILTNQVVSESGVIRSAISDHDLIYCTITCGKLPKGDVSAQDIAHARNVVLQSRGNMNHLVSAIYQDSIRELGEAKCRYIRSTKTNEIEISSRMGRHTRKRYMRPYISVPPSAAREGEKQPDQIKAILREKMCPLRSLVHDDADGDAGGDADEGTNDHIVNGLCDIFNSLLDAPPVEVNESEFSQKLFDTFEFMLLGSEQRAKLTTESGTRSALRLSVKESLEAKKLVYGCFYKFDAVSFNGIASLLPVIKIFPRDRMRNYFREREYRGANCAHSPLFYSLLQSVKDENSTDEYSGKQIQVFACRNEIAICINYTKADCAASELQLRKVLKENMLILSNALVQCVLFRDKNLDKIELLKEYDCLENIRFLGQTLNEEGKLVE